MADFQFNVSLGREVEFYNRVNDNDPTNAAFIMLILASSGLEPDSTLKDYDTVFDLLAGTSNEVTNTGYSRKTITDANIAAYTVDDTNDQILLTLPVQLFTTISSGDVWAKIIVAYDPDTTGGTDTTLIPISGNDCKISNAYVAPNGGDITIDLSSGWIKAR